MEDKKYYLNSLNSEQKKAVLATEGPVLIVAGAGAGKTKTLTHRILHIIASGVSPERILAITFTNKAAREMRERVMSLLENDTNLAHLRKRAPFISTFHSLGVQIIKENAEILKLPRHFSIFDTSDTKKTLKDVLTKVGLDPKEHLERVRHIISGEKGRGVTVSEYEERASYDFNSEMTKKVWVLYEESLKKEHALDFDDLLLKTLKLLEKYPDVLTKYQERFLYIHIDEYQDTNKVQNSIVEMLARKNRNICVVGDTDQNIYSWRGAEIKNMLHFERSYPEVQTFFLEQNYRSTKNILAVANEIIEKNNFRIPKKLFTENDSGEKIGLFEGRNEIDEAHFIALKSKWLIENGVKADHIAVLYRANFQSRVLEDAFLSYGVPYQMLGTKFFERKEIKDMVSFIRASLNPENVSDFARIINIPARGIGKTTLQKIMEGKESELPESMKIKINNFRKMLLDFKNVLTTEKPSEALKYIVKKSGIEDSLKTGLEEDTDRLENIMELVTLATKYDELTPEEGIEKFLTDTSLASDQDSLDGEKTGVRLMTVHASKGLEFNYVFICGLENDLFPHKGMGESRKSGEDAEEERRLFYVAVTRAGKKLFLTYAQTRTIFGTMEVNSPSEFIDDIPSKYIDREGFGESPKAPLFSIDF
ncbi:MAG: DNA helicase II / ATP-dependent DNA helicase PcrA [Parcubacteria bacterium C7867-006]|nr:MAG: DNA helicase II / ATP-dependent DNA helicase PcrA [Parcubacteria bacterium C7867-006]